MIGEFKKTVKLIQTDLRARIRYRKRAENFWNYLNEWSSPAGHSVFIWRIQSFIHHTPLRPLNKLLKNLNIHLFSIEIEPEAEIGEGFMVLNPCGIMIHGKTFIGENNIWAHQITTSLGPRAGFDPEKDYIEVGDNVVVSGGVRIIGDVRIGKDCWIGPNSVVTGKVADGEEYTGNGIE